MGSGSVLTFIHFTEISDHKSNDQSGRVNQGQPQGIVPTQYDDATTAITANAQSQDSPVQGVLA